LLNEQSKGELSLVSWQAGKTERPELTDDEIRERMSATSAAAELIRISLLLCGLRQRKSRHEELHLCALDQKRLRATRDS